MPRSDKKIQPGKKPVATIPTLSLEELQKRRTNYAKELQRRGGSKNAPGYAKKFNETTQSIRDLRKNPTIPSTQQPGNPSATSPIYAPDNFDAEGYLANNKDVADSIRNQLVDGSSGDRGIADLAYEHWKNLGRKEGRGEQYFRMPGDPAAPSSPSPAGAETEQGTTVKPPDFWSSAYENNPSYRYARDEAQSEMSKFLAAKGLTNSGAEIAGMGKMMNQLVANETDRVANEQYRWANMMASNEQLSADRNAQMTMNDAEASRNRENDYWDRMYKFTNLAVGQDPSQYAQNAASAMSDVLGQRGSAWSNYYSNNYAKPTMGITPPSGGGGRGRGGASVAPFYAPYPTTTSQLPYMGNMAGYGNSNSWLNAFNQTFGGYLGGKK